MARSGYGTSSRGLISSPMACYLALDPYVYQMCFNVTATGSQSSRAVVWWRIINMHPRSDLANYQLPVIGSAYLRDSPHLQVWQMRDQLQHLDLNNCGLQEISGHQLMSLSKLESLNLASNHLQAVPCSSEGSSLPLRSLDLSNNPLQEIPETAFAFCSASLTSLRLSGKPSSPHQPICVQIMHATSRLALPRGSSSAQIRSKHEEVLSNNSSAAIWLPKKRVLSMCIVVNTIPNVAIFRQLQCQLRATISMGKPRLHHGLWLLV